MSAEPPITIVIAVIIFSVLLFGALAAGVVLVIHDTIRQRGNWGINFKQVICTQCGTPMAMVRKPTNWHQFLWGGGTCPECGFELDKWGRPIESQNMPAKWKVLRAIDKEEQIERPLRHRDERIQETNDRMQRSRSTTLPTGRSQADKSYLPRSYLWYARWGAVAGGILPGFCLALGGFTGLLRTEYKTTPDQQALILGLMGAFQGVIPGLLCGLLIGWLRRHRGVD